MTAKELQVRQSRSRPILSSLLIIFFFLLFPTGQIRAGDITDKPAAKVKTGIEVLRQQDFELLKDLRVGLVTNPTGVDSRLRSTADILFQAKEVNLVALYGPEHGVRGNLRAGVEAGGETDPETGLPVHSLYGKTRKPTPAMLEGIEVLVFDIQDIGCRSYTYISTLGLVMEAAAENGLKVVVLDRPNPLGGNLMEGMLWEEDFKSFVSRFNIPYVHGLTVGELARLLNGEGMLSNGVHCDLEVVKMKGWRRDMIFVETGLPWVPTSPHIPRAETPFFYGATGIIGELNPNLVGVGYTLPFQVLAAPWLEAEKLAAAMNDLNMAGVLFRPIRFKPYYKEQQGQELEGVQIHFTDYDQARPSWIQFEFLHYIAGQYPEHNLFAVNSNRLRMFDLVCGSAEVRKIFLKDDPDYEKFKKLWNSGIEDFKKQAGRYYLYE